MLYAVTRPVDAAFAIKLRVQGSMPKKCDQQLRENDLRRMLDKRTPMVSGQE